MGTGELAAYVRVRMQNRADEDEFCGLWFVVLAEQCSTVTAGSCGGPRTRTKMAGIWQGMAGIWQAVWQGYGRQYGRQYGSSSKLPVRTCQGTKKNL